MSLNLEERVKNINPTTEELIRSFSDENVEVTPKDLFSIARSLGVGLARNGKWYHFSENEEVREAVENNKPTFLADQWSRNRVA